MHTCKKSSRIFKCNYLRCNFFNASLIIVVSNNLFIEKHVLITMSLIPPKKPIIFTELIHHDFPLITCQLTNDLETRTTLPWIKQKFLYSPYCVFQRKNGLLYYYYDQRGIDWKIAQAGKFDKKIMIKHVLATFNKIKDPLLKEKALPKKQFLAFLKHLETDAWTWWECMWWMIEYYDKHNLPADDLLALRKKTEYLAPGIQAVIRKSLAKIFPKHKKYYDVISIQEVKSGKLPSEKILQERLDGYVYTKKKFYKSISVVEKKFNIQIEKPIIQTQVLTGQVAYPGHVKGHVRLIRTRDEVKYFKQDEIIVSSTTTPDFLPAMKKSAAIISEHGGIICHASITSRELKIPCVVGVKGATVALKTGDYVEVDAVKGIVRILKKK